LILGRIVAPGPDDDRVVRRGWPGENRGAPRLRVPSIGGILHFLSGLSKLKDVVAGIARFAHFGGRLM